MTVIWRWISKSTQLMLHDEGLAEQGGGEGVRDEGLLDLALARPLHVMVYSDAAEPPDVATLAVASGDVTPLPAGCARTPPDARS